MTTALDRTRRALDQAPPDHIPGQLAVTADPAAGQPENDEQPLVHHQPSLWSL